MRRIVTALAVSATLAALAAPAAAAPGAASRSTAAAVPTAVASSVRLPTGDAVLQRIVAGHPQVSVVAADRSGPQGQFATVRAGGDTYVFPAEARPFLGGVLDPSLFDVTTLAASATSGRIPVDVTAASGAAFHLPGFTATSHSGTVTSGYLATSAATALRTGLVAAWRSVATPGAVAATSLFGGVTHLTVAHAPAVTTPDFPQVTLIIKVLDSAGKPAAGGFLGMINTDDARKFETFVTYQNGEARVSLPYGHYSAITDVATFTSNEFIDRIIPIADFTVSRNLQTLTIDARTATAVPSVHTPKPAALTGETVEFDRDAPNGSLGSSFGFGPDSEVRVAPTARAQHGDLEWLTTWSLLGGSAGSPYTYDLSFLDSGAVSPDQSHTVAAFQVATVNARYYNDSHRHSQFVRVPIYPFQFGGFAFFNPLETPQARTEYIYSPPSAVWIDQLIAYPTDDNPFAGFIFDDPRYYTAGSVREADWLRGPLAPSVPAQTNGDTSFLCQACRTATKLSVFLAPVTDTTPGHGGLLDQVFGGSPVSHFAFYRNGALVGGGPDLAGGQFTVPPGAATYRIHDTTDRSLDQVKTSTTTSTDLTFRSAATGGAGVPSGWECGIGTATSCTVLPLLHATVPLPTTLLDTLPVGTSTFDFTISRIQGAAPATITAASLATSVNGGPFVKAAVVAVGGGVFRATIVTPSSAAGHAVSLRVTGADSAGSTISQTVTAAYLVAK